MGTHLVTGATGHVGANLVAHLNQAGVTPRVLLRPTSKTTAIDDLEWTPITGDVTDPASLAAACDGVEVVYHVAAAVSFWARNAALVEAVNVQGTRNVAGACLASGVSRMVHCGSVAGVGLPEDPADALDESAVFNLGGLGMHYAESKHRAELAVQEAVARGLDAVVVHPSLVFGERDVNLNAGRMLVSVQRGVGRLSGPGSGAVCEADDVARALIAAGERGGVGHRYLVASGNYTYRELFALVADCVGGPGPLLTLPAGLILATGWFSERVLFRFASREPLITWEVARQATLHNRYDGSRLTRELGVVYTPFEQTLEKTRRWLVGAGLMEDRR